jgi:hypothetical protein
MTLPTISDIAEAANTDSEKLVRWGAALLLTFVLGLVYTELQARKTEHMQLLTIGQVQCFNHAENNIDPKTRPTQMRRCLTMKIDPFGEP